MVFPLTNRFENGFTVMVRGGSAMDKNIDRLNQGSLFCFSGTSLQFCDAVSTGEPMKNVFPFFHRAQAVPERTGRRGVAESSARLNTCLIERRPFRFVRRRGSGSAPSRSYFFSLLSVHGGRAVAPGVRSSGSCRENRVLMKWSVRLPAGGGGSRRAVVARPGGNRGRGRKGWPGPLPRH